MLSSSLVKKTASIYDFSVLNIGKNKILVSITMFSSFTYASPSGFPFFPIIHEKVMNVTLSLCTRKQANKRERAMTIESEQGREREREREKKTTKWQATNEDRHIHINPFIYKQNNWTISDSNNKKNNDNDKKMIDV